MSEANIFENCVTPQDYIHVAIEDVEASIAKLPDVKDRCRALQLLIKCISGKNEPEAAEELGTMLRGV